MNIQVRLKRQGITAMTPVGVVLAFVFAMLVGSSIASSQPVMGSTSASRVLLEDNAVRLRVFGDKSRKNCVFVKGSEFGQVSPDGSLWYDSDFLFVNAPKPDDQHNRPTGAQDMGPWEWSLSKGWPYELTMRDMEYTRATVSHTCAAAVVSTTIGPFRIKDAARRSKL